ncbi:hypothetical protein C0991_000716 [Blastosporella zonata]|nr:hypothetical protein C0991_000716 [Blastosporella zonata]
MATPSLPVKSHSSPSKAPSYGRTYDSKLVTREMHRLGNLSALAPPVTTPASASYLSLPAPPQPNIASTSSNDPWGALHVHVLPLFNGEPLGIPIEDLNVYVKRHIQAVVSSAPSKALSTLENDAAELIASGMVTLNAKLMGIDDDKLIPRVVEIWGFFWDQVLTYVEGVLLPLQTDPLLLSLYRTPKTHLRATSPPRQGTAASTAVVSASHIDVRSVALRSFRDKVILPLSQRLYLRLSMPNKQDIYHQETAAYQQPRLQQMLLVLTSQRRPRALAFSLTSPAPTPTPGEQAITDLLRVVRAPSKPEPGPRTHSRGARAPAPSFLSGALPRDRRGRIAHKQVGSISTGGSGRAPRLPASLILNPTGGEDDVFGGGGEVTPRGGSYGYGYGMEREREIEVLEALRSPDVDAGTGAGAGGWGLGEGGEDVPRSMEEEEDEVLEQEIKDYMVGMTENWRRMT